MKVKPVYEFLLWENCRNHCSFCFQEEKNQCTEEQKIDSLNKLCQFLSSDQFVKGSHILLVGGELFDTPSFNLSIALKSSIDLIIKLMLKNDIDLLYINTNLIYKKLDVLEYLLSSISSNSLSNRLRFTTSYDIVGRFSSSRSHDLMLRNLSFIKDKYSSINVIINTILTNAACESINSNSFVVRDFEDKYKCKIRLIPYIVKIPELRADKIKVFSTIYKVALSYNNPEEYIKEYIYEFDIKQEKLLYRYNKHSLEYCTSAKSSCGHSENFKMYSSDNSCFVCDLKALFD